MSETIHVLIIGAGITGLLIAQGLKSAGIKYTVFETSNPDDPRTREWTLGVHYAGTDLESLLPPPLYFRLREAYTDPHHVFPSSGHESTPVYNTATGEKIHAIPRPDTINVSRRRMRKLCSEGIEVKYGMAFTGVEFVGNEAVAKFDIGGKEESVKGDLVIGADGTRSVVRECLLGAEKAKRTMCDLELYTTVARYRDPDVARRVRSLDPQVAFGYHPEGMFNMIAISNIPDPEDPTTWEFYLANSTLGKWIEKMENEEIVERVRGKSVPLAEPWRSSFLEMEDDMKFFNDRLYYWIPQAWNNHDGRITLAGDAAHPMPPYRGQGLGQSIRDAAILVKSLKNIQEHNGKNELAKIINEYEEEMIKRGGEEVEMSVRTMTMVHDWQKLMQSPFMKFGGQKIADALKKE
ncbi:related to monooxygenase [Phialocephala subalpina]|uniref:Related to monooxygenase n=1 Tax=Phialocephala subalpina TaxID=576137 RepID=A0A1L7WT55_9HELO|nr:related to monooxygenase [Phialocephala subalpina]